MSTIFWTVPTLNIKNLNKHASVDLIRFTPGGISRVELARQLQLTRAAMTEIVSDLLSAGIVREMEAHRQAGRHPIALEINPDLGRVIGMDIGATHLSLLLADFSARVLQEIETPIDIREGPDSILATAEEQVNNLLRLAGVSRDEIAALGVGVPGPLDMETGTVRIPPIMPGWDCYPIRDYFARLYSCPVALNNDAELGVLGEWAYGAGRGERNLVYVKVGTGVGSGLLLDGQIYRGSTGSAGEIGHITIDENGPECSCGNRGCLEAMSGGRAIANRASAAVLEGERTQLSSIPAEKITSRDVIIAARSGDLLAQQILIEAGHHLGTAIASMVNLFNPSMIVVGGNVAQIGDLFLEPVRQTVQSRSLRAASRSVRITSALLGKRSTSMGAVTQAISLALHKKIDKE